jgi:hypothetical protein
VSLFLHKDFEEDLARSACEEHTAARRSHVLVTLPIAHDGVGASAVRSPRVVRGAGSLVWERVERTVDERCEGRAPSATGTWVVVDRR